VETVPRLGTGADLAADWARVSLRPVYRLQLFAPVPPIETGLAVPGDAMTLAMLDLDGDGWLYFLISQNGEATLAFHNRGFAGRHCLCVTLQGKAGNPQAVDAREMAVRNDND
jgi:hypothetical protein